MTQDLGATAWTNQSEWQFKRRIPVDGLRGVFAVLVVLFHMRIPFLIQGYAGVDGFFVISGFVITSILICEVCNTGSLNFWKFYAKRAKRLLPSSMFVLLCTTVVYRILANPLMIIRNRGSFLAAGGYCENYYLIIKLADYFAPEPDESPVMHYWSLAVEEHFYFFWPLSIFLALKLVKMRPKLLAMPFAILITLLVSFQLYISEETPIMTLYFATQFRIYQLMAGGLLSVILIFSLNVSQFGSWTKYIASALSLIAMMGFLCINTSLFRMQATTVGFISTVLSSILIITLEINPTSLLSWILSSPPVQFLGKHSYAIYLWHYPIILITKTTDQNLLQMALVSAAIIFISYLTYIFIDSPVQKSSLNNQTVVKISVCCTVIGLALIFGITQYPGGDQQLIQASQKFDWSTVPSRSPSPSPTVSRRVESGYTETLPLYNSTMEVSPTPQIQKKRPLHILLVGDSYAGTWKDALKVFNAEDEFYFDLVAEGGCAWANLIYHIPFDSPYPMGTECEIVQAIEMLVDTYEPDVLMLVNLSMARNLAKKEPEDSWKSPGTEEWFELMNDTIREIVVPVLNRTSVLFLQAHRNPIDEDGCFQRPYDSLDCASPAATIPGEAMLNEIYHSLASEYSNVAVTNLDKLVCPDMYCVGSFDGVQVFRNWRHLTTAFMVRVVRDLEALLEEAVTSLGL